MVKPKNPAYCSIFYTMLRGSGSVWLFLHTHHQQIHFASAHKSITMAESHRKEISMSRIISLTAAFLLTCAFIAAQGVQESQRPSAPEQGTEELRIISLSPALTEIVFALGKGESLAGVTTYCNYPEEATSIETIGGFSAKTINIEYIITLNPTLVIGQASKHEEIADALKNLVDEVMLFPAGGFDQVAENIMTLGQKIGAEERAAEITHDMYARLEKVQNVIDTIAEDDKVRVFWEIWDEPLMTAGPGTFTGEIIKLSGGINIFADVEQDWPSISHEEVVVRNPQVMMASHTHREKLSIEQLSARPGWSETDAVKNGAIFLLDGDMVSRPGPRVIEAVEAAASTLYPDLF